MYKVLIVDDSSTMRKIMTRVLRQAQIAVVDVIEASNGVESLAALQLHPDIGLVLLDVNMPEMNGIDLLKAIRHMRSRFDLPVLMVTTGGGAETVNAAMDLGANGYVCKPFTPDSIRSALEPYLT